ncbi:ATP-binding cassette domain-containing protein [uncultured Litoreibacter sp.]|uniref:ATP-binding cassette domain-containing protein n=1 Tax=uncultured Litoreibacter sp. TaxID=1392394 RepID=UPI002622AAD9|nr:ATP-binding cassette domain-containing protein [uncultured Litoreibacter sp.]
MSAPVVAFDMARAKAAAAPAPLDKSEATQTQHKKVPVIRFEPPKLTDPKPGFEVTPDAQSGKPPVIVMPSPATKVKPAPKAPSPIVLPDIQAANDAAPRDTNPPKRQRARADLAATYAGLLGVDLLAADILDAAADTGAGAAELTTDVLAEALTALGLTARVSKSKPAPDLWPAMVEMTTGQMVLVISQDGTMLTLLDATTPDKRTEVDIAEFAKVATAKMLCAVTTIEQVEDRYQIANVKSHWFWGEFTKYRRYIAEIALGSFVANILAVAVALFSLQVYDRVIPHQSQATLWVLAIGAVGALVMEAAIKIARSRLMDGAGRQVELAVQKTLMSRLLGMRGGQKNMTPSGTFSAMREFSSVREFFTASTIGSLTDIPFIFVFLLLVGSIAGNLVWVLVLGGILMVLPGFFLQRKMTRLTEETQGASVKASRLLQEAIYEADTVKANRGEDRFARIWEELTTLSAVKSSEQRKLAATLTFWSQGVQQATYVTAVVVGTFLVFAGEFTVGSIIAVGILTSRTLAPLTQLAGTMARWSNVKTALTGLEAVAVSEQDHDATRTYMRRETLDGRFEMRDLIHRYDDDSAPVLDISGVAIEPGQRVAVLGANGSGKSTMLKLLTGLVSPDAGRVTIDGIDMGQLHNRDLRRGIGYLAQDVRLFQGTLRDNLNLSQLERDDTRLMDALFFAGLGSFVQNHPKGLDLPVHDGGAGLSIGQRQSIGWARLWLADPRVVLLDEPTAALDQTLETTLVSRLETWLAGRTAVIATHRMPILSLTDRVLILQNGKLAVDGPRDAVLSHMKSARAEAQGKKETA